MMLCCSFSFFFAFLYGAVAVSWGVYVGSQNPDTFRVRPEQTGLARGRFAACGEDMR